MIHERIRSAAGTRNSLALIVLLLPLTLFLSPTLAGVFNRWLKFDQAYSHGLLLLFISIGLVVRCLTKHRFKLGFYPVWMMPLAFSLAAYSLGEVMRVQALSELVIVPLFLGAGAVVLGWHQVKPLIVPVGILFLGIPVWDYLAWSLQLLTVEVNRFLLGLLDINFRVEGTFVYLIGVGVFEVAHGCSGLRYLLVGQALALIFGLLNLRSFTYRFWLYIAAVALALVANWIRVFVIIYMGHETNMQSGLIREHDFFGWWVFAGTLVPLFLLGWNLEKMEDTQGEPGADDQKVDGLSGLGSPKGPLMGAFAVLFLIILAWLVIPSASDVKRIAGSGYDTSFVDRDDWLPLFAGDIEGWSPSIDKPDRAFENTYANRHRLTGTGELEEVLFVGLYSYESQRSGHELVHYDNRLYNSSRYLVEDVFELPVRGSVPLAGMTLRHRETRRLIHVAFGYYVEGRWENNELQAKLAQLPGLLNARTDASLLVVGLLCTTECEFEARLTEVSSSVRSSVQSHLDARYGSEE